MKKFIISLATLGAFLGGSALADDACQPLRDLYQQTCVNTQAPNKAVAALNVATCMFSARAIQVCEKENPPDPDDSGDTSDNDDKNNN